MQDNTPTLWRDHFPHPDGDDHKYTRGMVRIFGAPEMTGATRLAASACARMGAGMVVVLCTAQTHDIYRRTLPAHIVVKPDLKWNDDRITANLQGPGGLPQALQVYDAPNILDAAALNDLPDALNHNTIVTPHEGEFERAFPDLKGSREERALAAAREKDCIVVLKGHKTIIAAPDGRAVINKNAPPTLATAGAGDVLAGMIAGLAAQNMRPFEAACASVWIHGAAAEKSGAGLVASDLLEIIPSILQNFP